MANCHHPGDGWRLDTRGPLPVAKSLEVELAGGDYAVTQTMLTAAIGPRARHDVFPMRFGGRAILSVGG